MAALSEKTGKRLTGTVLSRKMEKTAVVAVEKLTRHSKYGKYIKRRINYMAHDEKNSAQPGDRVLIVETRPLSRLKRWRIKEIIERAK